MTGSLKAVTRALDVVIDGMNLVGSLLIGGLVLLVSTDVALRNIANSPLIGVPEIVALSIVGIVFLQLPYAMRENRLTRSDAIPDMLVRRNPSLHRWMEVIFNLVALVVVALILGFTWPLAEKAFANNLFIGATGTFTAPLWPVRIAVIVSCVVMLLQLLRHVSRQMGGRQ
ncbi:hypothetical protein NA8A_12280 [Nitratireductor indicus C115]|uniref:TRAP transporter small permease protein n=1 Tax=Nitratireductor indicus C115 TaxID=1231190 RepID=K2PML6_9HYPH|nr:TRAP transporter small permease [Nitratireductor indicus]EKF42327.1 hypothetical protein NA8A_12280 [Nitratireductor indicus C115]SFQ59577.1 TRAP-type mannitol/chloroaromatic compound transport system, small permease component [Nitratireductor indicus]